jgi:hypothetical protein
MTRRLCSILASAALIAALGACHQQQKSGHGEISGQILPGSVSDAMLPYDAVKSKAPLAPRQSSEQSDNALDGNAPDSADTSAAADSAVPDAAASPASAVAN